MNPFSAIWHVVILGLGIPFVLSGTGRFGEGIRDFYKQLFFMLYEGWSTVRILP